MFNLVEGTNHESWIYVSDDAVLVAAMPNIGDNRIPVVAPAGLGIIDWPVEDDAELHDLGAVQDIRDELPGTVFEDDGTLTSDMEIIWDQLGDIPALFGFRTGDADPDVYKNRDFPPRMPAANGRLTVWKVSSSPWTSGIKEGD